jgi:hypothetical protein
MGTALTHVLLAGILAGLLAAVAGPAGAQAPPPVGKPRTARDVQGDVERLLYDRRIAHSDQVGGRGGVAFRARACLKCHENSPGVEGQIFYGGDRGPFKDFAKDQWLDKLADPARKHAPTLQYDFVKAHEKRQKLDVGPVHEQLLKQNL